MKEKKCKLCGELFTPECPSNVICKRDHFSSCPICGKQIIWNSTAAVQPCSKECKKELTKQKNIAKYGVEHPMQSKEVQQHHRQAMLEKYGVESPLQCDVLKQKAIKTNQEKFGSDWALGNKDVKEKAKQTMIERYGAATTLESPILREKLEETLLNKYGVDNVMKNKETQIQASNTCFLKYGFTNPMQNQEIYRKAIDTRISNNGTFWSDEMRMKAKQTSLEHWGVDNPSKHQDILDKIKQTNIDKYGENYGTYLLRNVTHSVISNINRAFMKALEEHGLEYDYEFRGIDNYRYDIIVPNQQTVIEINPSYTHNAIGNHWSSQGLPNDYHLKKTVAATQAGYRCIHVFDWDNWDKVIEILLPKKKVYARNCIIYKLNPKVADEFLDKYHLQGTVTKQIINLGLVKDGELLQIMTFGSPRYDKHYYSELLRLCTKPGYAIVGGSERLFNFATKKLNIDEIISYCDLSKFRGDVYSKIGMKLIRTTEPQEVWSRGNKRITANLLRQRGYDQLFNANYGKGTSNEELMLKDGWLPVFDCGQAVYAYSSQA